MKSKNYYQRKFKRTTSKFKRKEIKRKFLNTLGVFTYVLDDEDFVFCEFEKEIKVKLPNSKVRSVEETIYWNTTEENNAEDQKFQVTRVVSTTDPSCAICYDGYKIGEKIVFSKNKRCPHHFHHSCIMKWYGKAFTNECPMCKEVYKDK